MEAPHPTQEYGVPYAAAIANEYTPNAEDFALLQQLSRGSLSGLPPHTGVADAAATSPIAGLASDPSWSPYPADFQLYNQYHDAPTDVGTTPYYDGEEYQKPLYSPLPGPAFAAEHSYDQLNTYDERYASPITSIPETAEGFLDPACLSSLTTPSPEFVKLEPSSSAEQAPPPPPPRRARASRPSRRVKREPTSPSSSSASGASTHPYQCFDHGCAGRTFSCAENFRRHVREQSRTITFECPQCGLAFSRKGNRDAHLDGKRCKNLAGEKIKVEVKTE